MTPETGYHDQYMLNLFTVEHFSVNLQHDSVQCQTYHYT